jgi:hypothetical protein
MRSCRKQGWSYHHRLARRGLALVLALVGRRVARAAFPAAVGGTAGTEMPQAARSCHPRLQNPCGIHSPQTPNPQTFDSARRRPPHPLAKQQPQGRGGAAALPAGAVAGARTAYPRGPAPLWGPLWGSRSRSRSRSAPRSRPGSGLGCGGCAGGLGGGSRRGRDRRGAAGRHGQRGRRQQRQRRQRWWGPRRRKTQGGAGARCRRRQQRRWQRGQRRAGALERRFGPRRHLPSCVGPAAGQLRLARRRRRRGGVRQSGGGRAGAPALPGHARAAGGAAAAAVAAV